MRRVRFRSSSIQMAGRGFIAGGLLGLALAAAFWVHEWRWSRSAERATGTITEMEARQIEEGAVAYFPHFRFRLPSGEIVQVVSRIGVEADAFSAGQVVPVLYRRADPKMALIATKTQLYGMSIGLGIAGVLLVNIGIVLFGWVRWREMHDGGPRFRTSRAATG